MPKREVEKFEEDPNMIVKGWRNVRNKFVKTVNKSIDKPIFHYIPPGGQEIEWEKDPDVRKMKGVLQGKLTELKHIEEEMWLVGSDYFESVNKLYFEMGPYTPQLAKKERSLLESGTMGIDWDYSRDGGLRGMTPEDIRKKYHFEVLPLPVHHPDGSEPEMFWFPIPEGKLLIHENGFIEIVRYYSYDKPDFITSVYNQMYSEIYDYLLDWANKHMTGEDLEKYKTHIKERATAVHGLEIGELAKELKNRMSSYRGYLQNFDEKYDKKIGTAKDEIKRKSASAKKNVKLTRTYKVLRTVKIPDVIEGETLTVPDEWMGRWEKWLYAYRNGDPKVCKEVTPHKEYWPKKRDADYIPENWVVGYYEVDEEKGEVKLHTLNDHGFRKLPDEWKPGFDEAGMPLEVDEDGHVMNDVNFNIIQKHLGRPTRPVRKVPKAFIKDLNLIDLVNIVHNEWDSYRDDSRDGRYHPLSPTEADYVMSICPHRREEWLVYDNDANLRVVGTTGQRISEKEVSPFKKGYKMRLHDGSKNTEGWTFEYGVRKASNLSPAFDRKWRPMAKWAHAGRLRWHDWPDQMVTGIADRGIMSSRGLSLYLIEQANLSMKFMQDVDTVLERFEGFDYGPRNFGPISKYKFPTRPFNLSNAGELNSPPDIKAKNIMELEKF